MSFTEKFLYHIWDAQHINQPLRTVSGKSVQILYQGRWNTDSGPDFKGGIIRIDNQILRGDVEIHIKTYDWKNHNHQEDKSFNNVVLHVVFEHNQKLNKTITENGRAVDILELKNQLSEDITKLLLIYNDESFKEKDKHCRTFGPMTDLRFNYILAQLGKDRLDSKKKRFNAELSIVDFNQLLFQGIMESAGYSKNKFQMLNLSIEISYSRLKSFYYDGMTQEEMLAILLCSSGLINHAPKAISGIWLENLKLIYKSLYYNIDDLDINWNLFRIRPVNHPFIRVLQLSDFIYDSLKSTFFYELLKVFSFAEDKFSNKIFNQNLEKLFSSNHEELPDNYKLGKERIKAILLNILIPIVILYAEKMNFPNLVKLCERIYSSIPGQIDNRIINSMSQFLDISKRKIIRRSAMHQQGLLKIYYDYCQHHRCSACKTITDKGF